MWINHRSSFQYHVKYIHYDILKPFSVSILQYAECVRQMHELDKYLTPPSNKGDIYDQSNWRVRDYDFTEDNIHITIKDVIPTSMQDEMEGKDRVFSLPHK